MVRGLGMPRIEPSDVRAGTFPDHALHDGNGDVPMPMADENQIGACFRAPCPLLGVVSSCLCGGVVLAWLWVVLKNCSRG